MIQNSVTLLVNKCFEAETVKIGNHIHQKVCEFGEERRVNVWILDPKGEKTLEYFSVDG